MGLDGPSDLCSLGHARSCLGCLNSHSQVHSVSRFWCLRRCKWISDQECNISLFVHSVSPVQLCSFEANWCCSCSLFVLPALLGSQRLTSAVWSSPSSPTTKILTPWCTPVQPSLTLWKLRWVVQYSSMAFCLFFSGLYSISLGVQLHFIIPCSLNYLSLLFSKQHAKS